MSFSVPLNQILLVRDIFIVLLLPSPVEFPIVKKKKAEALNKLGKQFPREWGGGGRALEQPNPSTKPEKPTSASVTAM